MAIFSEMPHKNENDSFCSTTKKISFFSNRSSQAVKITYFKVLHFAFHSIFKRTHTHNSLHTTDSILEIDTDQYKGLVEGLHRLLFIFKNEILISVFKQISDVFRFYRTWIMWVMFTFLQQLVLYTRNEEQKSKKNVNTLVEIEYFRSFRIHNSRTPRRNRLKPLWKFDKMKSLSISMNRENVWEKNENLRFFAWL